MIRKSTVLSYFNHSVKKCAEFFNVHPSAVYQWGANIPRERELELMLRVPERFPPKAA